MKDLIKFAAGVIAIDFLISKFACGDEERSILVRTYRNVQEKLSGENKE